MLDSFPNKCIAYRILLTIPIIVVSVEKSLSKLKFNWIKYKSNLKN